MTDSPESRPPRFSFRLMEKVFRDDARLGDFLEVYQSMVEEKGRIRAALWFRFYLMRSIGEYLVGSIRQGGVMFRNNLKISLRNMRKHKLFSLISISGMTIGMVCVILIMAFIRYELSYDRFFTRSDSIYRILASGGGPGGEQDEFAPSGPYPLGSLLAEQIPEIRSVSLKYLQNQEQTILQNGEHPILMDGIITDSHFLEIFDFQVISGAVEEALGGPKTIVLTERSAARLFGSQDPVGQTLIYRNDKETFDATVTAVIADVPSNSHLRFDFILSLETILATERHAWMFDKWGVFNFNLYLELAEGVQPMAVEAKIADVLREMSVYDDQETQPGFFLQPLTDIHLRSKIAGQIATNYQIRYVYLFGAIALVILLIACINHINLATARSFTRAREIGIRKVSGASRSQLFKQFISELIISSVLATGLAVALVYVFLPRFSNLIETELSWAGLWSPLFIVIVAGVALVSGILSGFYPALILSSYRPARIFLQPGKIRRGGYLLRNVLVVVQFSASIILMVSTMVILQQWITISPICSNWNWSRGGISRGTILIWETLFWSMKHFLKS